MLIEQLKTILSTWLTVILFGVGVLLGAGAGWLIWYAPPEPTVTTSPLAKDDGFQAVRLPKTNLKLSIRMTDKVSRLEDEGQEIGYKIFDQFAPRSGANIDVILERRESFYERPTATTIEAYKEAQEGLTIQDSREITLKGHRLLKQLYTAKIGQKRTDGAILTKPVTNLMRYIIEGVDGQIVILEASATFQNYLDTIAQSIEFTTTTPEAGEKNTINLEADPSDANLTPTDSDGVLFQSETGTGL